MSRCKFSFSVCSCICGCVHLLCLAVFMSGLSKFSGFLSCHLSLEFSSPSLKQLVIERERRGGRKEREERGSEGERSVLIIEAGSADVPSSLSARILPLALFSVSFFNITSFVSRLVDPFFSLSVSVQNTECLFLSRQSSEVSVRQ